MTTLAEAAPRPPASGPFAWHPHLGAWLALAAGTLFVVLGHRHLVRTGQGEPWTRRQRLQCLGALVALVVALTWPLADLATSWSLTALVLQRVVVVLAAAPLLVLGLPYDLIRWATRPPAVDAVLARCTRPAVAVVVVTVLGVGSMLPAVVEASAHHAAVRAAVDLGVLVAGVVLWLPVVGRIPGILRLRPVVRFAYLIFQAVVPAFLSFLYIFGNHPYYDTFLRSKQADHLRPLNDQQVAGFVSKLSMLLVLLVTAAVILARAPRDDLEEEAQFGPRDPLVWADVERSFERADRQARRRDPADPGPEARTDPETPPGSDTPSDSDAPSDPEARTDPEAPPDGETAGG